MNKGRSLLKRIATNTGLIILGLTVGFLLLEVIIRVAHNTDLAYLFPTGRYMESHKIFGWIHVPDIEDWYVRSEFKSYIKTNSRGFRDRNYPYTSRTGAFRILVLGDSFPDALEVPLENSFTKVLESQRGGFEVINGGMSGWGTSNEFLFFKQEGYKYSPDLVLLAFCANDIRTNSYYLDSLYHNRPPGIDGEKIYFTLNGRGLEPIGGKEEIQKSHTDRFKDFFKSINHYFKSYYFIKSLVKDKGEKVEGIPFDYLIYKTDYAPEWEEGWALTKALVLELKKEVEKHGAKLVVVIVTSQEQVYEEFWRKTLETYPRMKDYRWDLEKPNRILTEFLRSNNIDFLELLPAFREYAGRTGKRLHFHYDGHWNEEGHRLAAEVIYRYITKNNLIKDE